MLSPSASATENKDDDAGLAPWATLRSEAVTTGAWFMGPVTWNSFQALQRRPWLARTQMSSKAHADVAKLVCASCAAVTSLYCLAVCAVPFTIHCPLGASGV